MRLSTKTVSPLIFAILALTLSGCSGAKPFLAAEPPGAAPFRTELKKEMSTLNVAVEATSGELAAALNQAVPSSLYRGATGISGLSADISRNGPIAVSAADNYLYLTVPLSMSLNYSFFKTPPTTFKLKFKTAVRVTPDWKLTTEIYYMGLSDLFAEELRVGPLAIKPRSVVEGMTQPVQKTLSDMVSRKINDKFPLRPQVENAWKAAQKPVLLDRNYNAWLRISPRDVMLYPPSAQNNRVKMSLGLTSMAEVVVGSEPSAAPHTPLPNLKVVNAMDKNFRIAVNTDLYYRDIVAIASPLILGKDFGSEGKSVILKAFDVYGNGERLIVKVETKGSLDGVFYLTCKPLFNPQTNVFSVEDVDFDMNTESLLLTSADWFLHGTIRDMIREKLNVNLSERVEQARDMARKAVARVKLADHVFLKGNVASVKLHDVLVQKDKISIQVYSEGDTALVFQ
ncbi:MAG TPA: DUF4403 family protein [Geobacteraceae bacterium]